MKKCVEIDFFGAAWYNSVKVAICIMREGVNNGLLYVMILNNLYYQSEYLIGRKNYDKHSCNDNWRLWWIIYFMDKYARNENSFQIAGRKDAEPINQCETHVYRLFLMLISVKEIRNAAEKD